MASGNDKQAATDPLVPTYSPFAYNVGVNYESWEVGRTGYSIKADLDQIAENFKLVRTYHDSESGTTPIMDGTQLEVIQWMIKNPGMELVMGTNNGALAQGGYGSPWSAGLMTTKTYTDAWVQMLIDAYGGKKDGVANILANIKAILLGNELDMNGPPPTDPDFNDYVNVWIPAAFDNLKASLSEAGLGSIPISTTIANYGTTNVVSVNVPAYISANWSSTWNNNEPFVLFNQYTGDNQQSTQFGPVEQYFESVEAALGATLEVFIGETGYSTDWGAANQATVYTQIFAWLDAQQSNGGKTVPLFFFDAFDRPDYPAGQIGFGIYGEDSNSQPTGLKPGLESIFPSWTTEAVTEASSASESLYGGAGRQVIHAGAGDDIVLGIGGSDKLFGEAGFDLLMGNAGNDKLVGGKGMDYLHGGKGKDWLRGGKDDDTLSGGRGKDVFVLAKGEGTDTITDFQDGRDSLALRDGLKFGKLAFLATLDGTAIWAGKEYIAEVQGIRPEDLDAGDFFVI